MEKRTTAPPLFYHFFSFFFGKNCTTFTIGSGYALTWPWNSSLLHAPWRKNSLKRAHLPSGRLHCLLRVHGSTMMWISCSHVPIWKKRLIPCSTISNVLLLLITFFSSKHWHTLWKNLMFEPRWNLEGKEEEVVRQFFGPKRFCFKKVADKLSEISRWGWWSRAICKAAPISAHYEKEAYVLKPARSQPTTLLKTPWVAASVETGVNHNDREETLSSTPHPSVVKRREINGIWKASKLARFHVGVDVWHRRPSEGFTSKGNPPTPTDRPT